MPELAEVLITSEYVNEQAEGRVFHAIRKNPNHKGLEIETPWPFRMQSISRGKELLLILTPAHQPVSDFEFDEHLSIVMTMGMSGHFKWVEPGVHEKHAHLMFKSDAGDLAFVDPRRFGKWKLGQFSKDRSPDPLRAWKPFKQNILANLHKKDFDKPIHTVLMNQKYFNGIGNYLRAEILHRVPDLNPFTDARTALKQYPELFELCNIIPTQAYMLGGGQLKDWSNPFSQHEPESWESFMKCYGNKDMSFVIDATGRRFWYDSKWDRNDDHICYYSGLPSVQSYQ